MDTTQTQPVNTPAAAPAQASPVSSPAVNVPVTPAAATAPAAAQTSGGTPQAPAGWDYKSDPRFGKIWKTEADIIQGYHSLEDIHEKKYKPAFQKLTDLEKKFQENKLDLSKLDDYFREYSELQSPENPKNQTWNFLNELVDDDLTAQDFKSAVAKIQEEKLNRRFPGMTAEQRQQAIERDKKLSEMENRLKGYETAQKKSENLKVISNNESAIKKLCADKGFEFTDQIKNEFWNYCSQEIGAGNMTLNQMPYVFLMKYGPELDRAFENKIKSSQIEQQRATQQTTVAFAKKPQIAGQKKGTLADRLRSIYGQPPATST